MSLEVLQGERPIEEARERLVQRKSSCLGMEVGRRGMWQRLRGKSAARLGDAVKSWDILRTAEFLESRIPRTARILDIGAYNSEIFCELHRLRFTRLVGVDLNPGIREMPFGQHFRYQVGNFLRTPFLDRSFDVITTISVTEHRFDAPVRLGELSRLLEAGGCFVASVDYWPEKIDTADTRFFGMGWCISSSQEVEAFVAQAAPATASRRSARCTRARGSARRPLRRPRLHLRLAGGPRAVGSAHRHAAPRGRFLPSHGKRAPRRAGLSSSPQSTGPRPCDVAGNLYYVPRRWQVGPRGSGG